MSKQNVLINRTPTDAQSEKLAYEPEEGLGYDLQIYKGTTATPAFFNRVRDMFLPVGIIINSPTKPDFNCEWVERTDLQNRYLEATNDSDEVNTEVAAALPNITGSAHIYGVACSGDWKGTGAFYVGGTTVMARWTGGGSVWGGAARRSWSYDSSRNYQGNFGGYYNNTTSEVNLQSMTVRFWERTA